ncbi:hypothetical protein ABIC99_001757 [Sphaerotilus sulfidivorans]|uniref:Uncharacterized protein n=1 Tax=Sphaerotilus sulfidivorans TaxID=639200 RepID=A0A5C1PV91_9BURK|nr:hypothetical protein [Sphaerotilus sulfidivorans]NZD44951.1 hypothetical protein [Sphaerotilus sulfidivorans]QEM99612.1 hypothetical protein EWH46_01675 [Sphaerotilus sulfidivorans]
MRLPLLLPAGIKAGTIEVGVHWDQVGLAWAERLIHYQIKSKPDTPSDFELARLAWRQDWVD